MVNSLDDAWAQVLHIAFVRHLQFGRDIVFTYGPWGFLGQGYYPATHAIALLSWTILSLCFWLAGWRLAGHFSGHRLVAWLWLIGFTGMASMPPGEDIDARLAAWGIMLLFLHFFVEEGAFTPMQAMLAVSLGWLGLIKFSGFIEIAGVMTAIAVDSILRHRRFPWMVLLWLGSLLCFWIAARQHLNSIGPYLSTSWQIANGYTQAMNQSAPDEIWNIWDIGCFLTVSALLCGLTGYVAWLRLRFFGVLPLLGLVVFLFLDFKHGYVRCDRHEIMAVVTLGLTAMAVLAITWPVASRQVQQAGQSLINYISGLRHRFGMLPLLGLVALLFLSFLNYGQGSSRVVATVESLALAVGCGLVIAWMMAKGLERLAILGAGLVLLSSVLGGMSGLWNSLPARLAFTLNPQRILAPVYLVFQPGSLSQAYARSLAKVRERYPVPPLQGTTDIYPWDQSVLLASDLSYQGRPVFQSYSAYTPELARLNAAFLCSSRAPANVLFRVEPMDYHFPSLEDGCSWPELLTRYEIKGVSDGAGTYLRLSRSAIGRPFHLIPLQTVGVHFGETVKPPSASQGPIWAEIEINSSGWGRIVSLLYKPPLLSLSYSLRNGSRQDSVLVPAMARAGFLLSPVVGNNVDFAWLDVTNGQVQLADSEMSSMRISAGTRSGSTACYQSPMRIRFYRLDYPRQGSKQKTAEADRPVN